MRERDGQQHPVPRRRPPDARNGPGPGRRWPAGWHHALLAGGLLCGLGAQAADLAGAAPQPPAQPAATAGPGWTVVGRQGILIHVVVPVAQAREREAYLAQIPVICGASDTCFVNFYTNTTGATATLPLPDAIASEATAVLRRSAKQGAEGFRWSCRLALPEPDCF